MVETEAKYEELKKDVEKSKNEVDKSLEKAERRDRVLSTFSVVSIIALLLTSISLAATAWSYFKNSTQLNDATHQVEVLNSKIDDLENKIIELNIEYFEKQLEVLKEDYISILDKQSNEAKILETEIAEIQQTITDLITQLK
jgi:predicted  nucleic acid-binding Zn-ribbon protein